MLIVSIEGRMFGMGAILSMLPIAPDVTTQRGGRFVSPQQELLWFEYLAVSPSYELAKRFRCGRWTDADEAVRPRDFDDVLAVYDDLGDVQRISFAKWWTTRGVIHFRTHAGRKTTEILGVLRAESGSQEEIAAAFSEYTRSTWIDQGVEDTLLMAVPLELSPSQIMAEVRKAVKVAQEARQPRVHAAPTYQLVGKRIHDISLLRYLYVLYYCAMLPDVALWQIGAHTQISQMHSPYICPISGEVVKGADSSENKRKVLGILTHRARDNARLISENAARGIFPSNQKRNGALEFDYGDLRERMIARDNFRIETECLEKMIPREQYVGRQLEKLVKLLPRATEG